MRPIKRIWAGGVGLLMLTACGPQGDVDWVYADGSITLDLVLRRDAVPPLSVVAQGRPVRNEGEGCFEAGGLVGSTRQRLTRGVFGDLDFADWGNVVTVCGPLEWDMGNGVREFEMQLEHNVGPESWLWGNMWLPNGGGSLDLWMNRQAGDVEGDMAQGRVTAPLWISGWGEPGSSPCPSGQEWCDIRADLTLSWSFSDEVVEQVAW